MNFSLHYSIKYFKNNNSFPSIFFFQLMRLLGKISREMFNIPFKCRTLQRGIQMFISFLETLVMLDVDWLYMCN